MKTKNLKFDALRTLAEEMVGKETDSRISVAHEEVNSLIHELQVHQAELELQNEELRGLQTDLEKSRNRYYELFDSAPVGYIIIDAHYNIIEINSTALEQLGRPRQEMVGRPLLNSVRTGDHTRMVSFMRTIATSHERHEILIDLTTADGSTINARIDAVRSESEDKEHCRHLLTLTDLTELQKARETIEKSESIYRALVQSSADHIFLMSGEGRYLASNDNVAQLGAKKGSELIGRHFSEVLPSEVAELYREKFGQVVATQQPAAFEHDLPVDETCIFHHDKLYPIFRGGIFWAVGGICRDTTEQKTALRRNEKLEADLRQNQKLESLGTLAGGIAHDFNNILTSLIGYTELSLFEVEKGSPMEEYQQEVLQAGLRAKNLVAQILAFSRKSDDELMPVRIDKIAREVMKLIRPSLPSTIKIVFAAESNSVILGNPTQVHQILMNLCTNAAHAMQEKGGVLTIAISDVVLGEGDPGGGREDGHSVEIKVTDTGSGIAPDIIDRVYEPYFTTKGLGTGTGMGLAVVHGIVESYGGRIALESQLGQGTTVHIHLPVIKDRTESLVLKKTESMVSGKGRILFVDDEESIVKLNKRVLEHMGYEVTAYTDSLQALEGFRLQPDDFDLVITDMTMPGMTGEDLTVAIMKERQDIPVILCSGYSSTINLERAKDIGIRAFLYKPVDRVDMARTLREVLAG